MGSTTAGTECSLECSVFVEPEVPGTSYAYYYWPFLVKTAFWNWPVLIGFPAKSFVGVVLPAPSKLCVEEFSHAGKTTLSHAALRCVIYVFSVQKALTLSRTKATTLFDCVVVVVAVIIVGWRNCKDGTGEEAE